MNPDDQQELRPPERYLHGRDLGRRVISLLGILVLRVAVTSRLFPIGCTDRNDLVLLGRLAAREDLGEGDVDERRNAETGEEGELVD